MAYPLCLDVRQSLYAARFGQLHKVQRYDAMDPDDAPKPPDQPAPPAPGWWIASDGQWYPPHLDPRASATHGNYTSAVYQSGWVAPEDHAAFMVHSLRAFPVWAVGVLNFFTVGLFGLIHFGLMHDRLPRIVPNDPSAGRAIGFQFIPFFNLYWMFFNSLRFTDRLNLQFRLRGWPERVPRGLVLACCIVTILAGSIGVFIMWTIAVCMMQSAVNDLAKGDYRMIGYGLNRPDIAG